MAVDWQLATGYGHDVKANTKALLSKDPIYLPSWPARTPYCLALYIYNLEAIVVLSLIYILIESMCKSNL